MRALALSPLMAGRLARRAPLALDPSRAFAIKRNVHEIDIDGPADRFAAALREVLVEPGARFGKIVIRRAPGRAGQPFQVGERFMGCIRLGDGPLAAWLEERLTGDWAEVIELGARRASYRYLAGSPIAGQSTLDVEDGSGGGCRLRAIFEFQEVAPLVAGLLHRFALREHDRSILAQAQAAARRIGARVVGSTILV